MNFCCIKLSLCRICKRLAFVSFGTPLYCFRREAVVSGPTELVVPRPTERVVPGPTELVVPGPTELVLPCPTGLA